MQFEYFLAILKNAEFIIGNSSSGVREAPVYGVKTINLGNRQNNRNKSKLITNLDFNESKILSAIKNFKKDKNKSFFIFGSGGSAKKFIKIIKKKKLLEN